MKALKKQNLTQFAGLAIGGAAASKVSNIKLPVNLPAPIQSALPLILGVFLAGKKGMIGDIGKGMVAAGGAKLINALVPSLGIGSDDSMIQDYMIEGADGYALAGAMEDTTAPSIGNTSYALAGVDRSDSEVFG